MPEHLICYDLYRAMLEEAIAVYTDPNKARQWARAQQIDTLREVLADDPTHFEKQTQPPPGLLYLLRQLKQCHPYILAQPVVTVGMEMVRKAGTKALPIEPFLSLPLWIEFDQMAVGDEETHFVAVFLYRDPFDEEVRCDWLEKQMQRIKTSLFKPDGQWEYEQMGTCERNTCTVAHYTVEGRLFRLREQDKAVAHACTCWQGGFLWSQMIRVLNFFLLHRKEPVSCEELVRTVPVPYAHPTTRREKEANSAASRASRPNLRVISLSAPVSLSQREASTQREAEKKRERETISLEKISVEGHWRVLIPGEGKPWKALQIIPIESYQRSQSPAEERTRFHVEW